MNGLIKPTKMRIPKDKNKMPHYSYQTIKNENGEEETIKVKHTLAIGTLNHEYAVPVNPDDSNNFCYVTVPKGTPIRVSEIVNKTVVKIDFEVEIGNGVKIGFVDRGASVNEIDFFIEDYGFSKEDALGVVIEEE